MRMADEAGKVARQYFRLPFDVESKIDASPVTIADRAIEKKLREIIEEQRPDDGILGEEYGIKESRSGYTWVLDPIDGTKSFIIGRPTFGTLIALCEGDRPVLGIIDQPVSAERWLGTPEGTVFNGRPVKTRPCTALSSALVTTTDPLGQFESGLEREVYASLRRLGKTQAVGGDCMNYAYLSCGWADIVIETKLAPYDFAALVPVVEGAGGMICDWEGLPLTLKSDGRVLALGDKSLWPQVKPLLK